MQEQKDLPQLMFEAVIRIAATKQNTTSDYAAKYGRQVVADLLGVERIAFEFNKHGTALDVVVFR